MAVKFKNLANRRQTSGPSSFRADFQDDMPLPGGPEGAAAPGDGEQKKGLRRPYPGTVCVRVDRYDMQDMLDKDGNPVMFPVKGPDGRPVKGPDGNLVMESRQAAVGFYGTTTCSHEQIYMRLSTDEESMADNKRHVSANRRSINVIRTGASDQSVRGRHGELMNPEVLPEGERPIFRCDSVMPVTEGKNGPELETPDGFRQYRTSWITAICNYQDREGNQVQMLDHIERDAWSTVDLRLSRGKEGSPNYRDVFRNAVKRCAEDEKEKDRFSVAAYNASKDVLETWKARQKEISSAKGNPESFGFMNVTTWRPEKIVRVMPGDDPEAAQKALENIFNEPQYQEYFRVSKKTGEEELVKSPMRPAFIVRLLDESGAVCGMVRMNDYLFNQMAEAANEDGNKEEAAALATPAGRAAALVNILGSIEELESGEKPVGIDILPGDSCSVSQNITTPGFFGKGGATEKSAIFQAQQLVQLGLEHSALPVYQQRQSVGCSQLFVTRTDNNVVTGVFKTKDGGRYRNAVILGPEGVQLPMSPAFKEEIEKEIAMLQKYGPALEAEAAKRAESKQANKRADAPEPNDMPDEPPLDAYEEEMFDGPSPR